MKHTTFYKKTLFKNINPMIFINLFNFTIIGIVSHEIFLNLQNNNDEYFDILLQNKIYQPSKYILGPPPF
jgi:hypothetical protein